MWTRMCSRAVMTMVVLLAGSASADLVSWWSFDSQMDPGEDNSGNGRHGTLYPAAPNGPGWQEKALVVDGIDDYMEAVDPVFDFTTSFKLSATVTLTAEATDRHYTIIGHRNNVAGDGYELAVTGPGKVEWYMAGNGKCLSNELAPRNEPFTVIATWNAATSSATVELITGDGVDSNSCSAGAASSSLPLRVGTRAEFAGGKYFWEGSIHDVKVYDSVAVPKITYDPRTSSLSLDTKDHPLNGFIIESANGSFAGNAVLPEGFTFNDNDANLIASQLGNVLRGTHSFGPEICPNSAVWNNGGYWDAGDWQFTYTVDGEMGIHTGEIEILHILPGDVDADGDVDAFDIQQILAANSWLNGAGWSWAEGDFNSDGLVNADDIQMVLATGVYGTGPYDGEMGAGLWSEAFGVAVPEPTTLTLLALGAAAMLGRKRNR